MGTGNVVEWHVREERGEEGEGVEVFVIWMGRDAEREKFVFISFRSKKCLLQYY